MSGLRFRVWCLPLLVGLLLISVVGVAQAQPPPGMVSYWKFDEGAGTTASDSVDANPGTIYGPSWATGKVASALSFDGIDDYVIVPDSPNLCPADAITIEAWIMPREMDFWWAKHIVAKGDPDYWDFNIPNSAYEFLTRNYPYGYYQLEFGARFEGGWAGYRTDTGPLTLNDWNHVAVTYDGSYVKIYVDGNKVLEQPQTGKIIYSTFPNMPLQIGASISTRPDYPSSVCYFNGVIDEVAIYNRALTLEEIQQHYQNGLEGKGYFVEIIPPIPELSFSIPIITSVSAALYLLIKQRLNNRKG